MIVSKEQRDAYTSNGILTKELVISYVNKDHGISFLTYLVPPEDLFSWKYSTRRNADPVWRSYDEKYVRKVPAKKLDEMRINEVLMSFGNQIDPIFEMNRPITKFVDIEVDVDDTGFPDAENANNPINTIAITKFPNTIVFGRKPLEHVDSVMRIQKKIDEYAPSIIKGYKFEYVEFKDEKSMLEALIDHFEKLPAITGWNFLNYDWTYIINRCKKLNLNWRKLSPTGAFSKEKFALKGRPAFYAYIPKHKIVYDYLLVYSNWDMSIMPKENNSLDFVAEKALGIKKVNHNMGFKEFYRDHYDDYVFYNAIDTILVEKIDEKLKTADIWYSLTSELKIDLNMAFSTIAPTQVVMCDFIYDEKKVIPLKEETSEATEYQGAFVWPSRPGIFKHIMGLDYASLYPSTQRQFNISPEKFLRMEPKDYRPGPNEIMTCTGAIFDKTTKGILPRILDTFFAKRKEAKKCKKQVNQEYEDLKHILDERMKSAI